MDTWTGDITRSYVTESEGHWRATCGAEWMVELPDDPDADPERPGGPFAEKPDEHRLELFTTTCGLCGSPDCAFKKVGHQRQHLAVVCPCGASEIIV